jgi:hypothetical protein
VSCGYGERLLDDARDFERRKWLAMSSLASIVLSPPKLEDGDFWREVLGDDSRLYLGSHDERSPDQNGLALGLNEQHLVEGDGVTDIAFELFDTHRIPRANPVLLSAHFEDRVHLETLGVVAHACARRGQRALRAGARLGKWGGQYTDALQVVK